MKQHLIFAGLASMFSLVLITCTATAPQITAAAQSSTTPSPTIRNTLPLSIATPFANDFVLAPIQAGELSSFQADILVPRTAIVKDQVVFRDQMVFEWRFKAAQGQDNSLIASVAITIFQGASDDSGSPIVYHRIATEAPYCVFGHTTAHCDRIWRFADTNNYWPETDSDSFKPSKLLLEPSSPYTAQMRMTTRDGRSAEWDFIFSLQEEAQSEVASEVHFVHIASAKNITRNWTEIDQPLANGNPHAVIFVTQNWNPDNKLGVYNNHPIGVWYNPKTKHWGIFNQDLVSMPIGAAFNVLIFSN